MPNRVLRDWTDSDRINKLSTEAEIFFVRLIMKVDDYGRFHADPQRLKSACYPLKDSIRNADISRWLAECEKAGLICCYDANGCRYLCILRFNQRLRIMHERYPRPPDGHLTVICPSSDGQMPAPFVSDSDSDSDSRKRDRDAREREIEFPKGFPSTTEPYQNDLEQKAEQIYEVYPRKVARQLAIKSIIKCLKIISYDKLFGLTTAYTKAVSGEDMQFIPHPTTWFNQHRFNDDPSTWSKGKHDSHFQSPAQHVDRSIGTANEGTAALYRGIGRVAKT